MKSDLKRASGEAARRQIRFLIVAILAVGAYAAALHFGGANVS